ncbi:response regulator [Mesorhizobium sp. M2E.F.Ca.ET.209.01.1.1]|nr:MAG: response regulator [Mesorhizobium sp.]TGQ05885.1 response regulator [Mesorhizobium sp. M2E.F.Ca.ET.219.01.1.1]TGS11051.1 response regulator [Mesorhizobium sp. M2E.F.Ca.ET.209.01.1.1]
MPRIPMVAIVDDDMDVRVSIASLMRSAGYDAAPFASAADLLDSAKLNEAAVIITDLQMPGMTGLELLDVLRLRGYTTPVVFITAYPEKRTLKQATSAGAVGFFIKPYDPGALLDCVDAVLSQPS